MTQDLFFFIHWSYKAAREIEKALFWNQAHLSLNSLCGTAPMELWSSFLFFEYQMLWLLELLVHIPVYISAMWLAFHKLYFFFFKGV